MCSLEVSTKVFKLEKLKLKVNVYLDPDAYLLIAKG